MAGVLSDLPWLPPPPADLKQRCKAMIAGDHADPLDLLRLASCQCDEPAARLVARAMRSFDAGSLAKAGLVPMRLRVLAASTFDLVAACLPAAALRRGMTLAVDLAPYGQIAQAAFSTASAGLGAHEVTLISADHRWFGLDKPALAGPVGTQGRAALGRLGDIILAIRAQSQSPIVLQTLPTPPEALFGGLDRRVAGTPRAEVAVFNHGLWELAAAHGATVFDVAGLAENVGLSHWFNPVQWNGWKLPFDAALASLYADALARVLGALLGRSRKCLVLDLDNTLWGGVLGDDGLDGLTLGEGTARGEAFLSVQRYALALRARGVLLAVSSRNDDATARRAIAEHPEMILRPAHFAAIQANWTDKPSNLEAIARQLDIGLDALVMLDDNPAERAHIRAALPMVAVPELPADPAHYVGRLDAAGYFEALTFGEDDLLRADAVQANSRRSEVQQVARNLEDYLANLHMSLRCTPFDSAARGRIVQLANKTNQFNLTTRRTSEAEVAAIEADPACITLQVRLSDKFGDLGLISLVVARKIATDPTRAEIETWAMSCRVLGRKVEHGVLDSLVIQAAAAGVTQLIGRYRPSPKNSMVADHYANLGFHQIGREDNGDSLWALMVADYRSPDLPFRMET
jgi:FkbH-like protein